MYFYQFGNIHQFAGDIIEFMRWIGTVAKYKAIDQYRLLEKLQKREQALIAVDEWRSVKMIQDQVLKQEAKMSCCLP